MPYMTYHRSASRGVVIAQLKLYVFGPPRLEYGGQLIALNLRKALALLVYLAVSGQPQSRDALATLLWPDCDQSEGRTHLRRVLHRLQQALGNAILEASPETIRLHPAAALWLDSAAFRQHVTAGLPAAPDAALVPDQLTHLQAAIDLYTDDFLAGFTLPDSPAFDEWQFFVRESLRQLYGQVLEQLIAAHRAAQSWETAIGYARRWVSLDGLHEPAQRTLIQLYAWAGQLAAAARQYQECVRLLDAELGAAPEEQTTALYEAIRTRQFTPPETADRPPTPPLVPEPDPHERFVPQELLAMGGQGAVYRGHDRATGQPVAIKRLKPDMVDRHPDALARIVREGAILRQLQHPNIVGVLAAFEHAGQYSIVMEYMPGGSLRTPLEREPQLPLDRVLTIGLELADALSRAHHLGIIHRDLKPENVLVAADGTPRLSDFGMACLEAGATSLTQSGTLFGSPTYMSPEALRGEEMDARTDIWSLGVLLYELLAGQRPFAGAQITPVVASILQDPVPDLEQFRADVPAPLVDLLRRMLVKERAQRMASMRQVAAELEAIRAGGTAQDRSSPQPGQAHAVGSSAPGVPAQPPTSPGEPMQPAPFVSRHQEQQIRFCTVPDGVQIAYATVGAGPVLVKAANWLSHLEFDWNSPVWRHWLTGLSAHHTLVRYDERGCGLSDWEVDDFSLEAWVRDLETVVDMLGLERFPLLGISQGGPVAIAYAVRHPEKVSHLILYGSYACGLLRKRSPTAAQLEELETLLQLIKVGWGQDNPAFRQVFTTFFMPEATAEQMHWFNDLQRMSTSPGNAVKFRTAFSQLDVRDLATRVTTPTLVLHARDDAAEPFEEGRRLAALIPGARFIPLEGKNHLLLESEPAWQRFLVEVDRFLGGPATAESARAERLLAQAKPIADARPSAAAQGAGAANSAQIDQSPAGDRLPLNLLATKLFVPRPRPNAVRRARLLVRLDAALHTPLTLVAAPAGFGKTTVLADWLAARSFELRVKSSELAQTEDTQNSKLITHNSTVAWLSLDDGDNDPGTFLRYLIAAFQTIAPTVGGTTLALLSAPQPPGPETLLRLLLNDLAALAQESLLVLDDYHLITTPAIHTAMTVLLDHLPPTLHLVIATRADPPLPMARLRARGQLVELRAADLRFTIDEAAAFLTEVMVLPLTAVDVAALEARTEGWIAGLQLAALAMQDHRDLSGFIRAFTGSNRFVVDYLAAEVFARQPAHVQTFLLHTAILDRLCGPLCDAVMGVAEQVVRDRDRQVASATPHPRAAYTQALLEALERANLFLVPLDDQRRWYRYHHLFGEVLRERLLSGAAAADVAALHQRASAWFAQQGFVEEAIQHALAAGAPAQAAHLVEQHAEAMIMRSQITTLQRWIEALPEEVVYSRHRLAIAAAGVQMTVGNFPAVEPLIQAAERAQSARVIVGPQEMATPPVPAGDLGWLDDVAGTAGTLRSFVARAQNDLPRAIALARTALDQLPKQFLFLRSSVAWLLGAAYSTSGDLAAAGEAFVEVWADSRSPEQLHSRIMAASSLGQIRIIQGRLREAAQLYRQSLQESMAATVPVPSVGMIHVGLGEVLREWNNLDGATRHLTEGIVLGKLFGSADVLVATYTTLARVKQAQGDHTAASELLAQAHQFTPGLVHTLDSSQRIRALLAHGDSSAVADWVTRNGIDSNTPISYQHETEQIILTRVLVRRAAYAEALGLLERLAAATEAGGRIGTLIEVLVLQALAYRALGDRHRALTALEQALTLAEGEGYVRIFVDEGAPIAELLAQSAARTTPDDIRHSYIARLLSAFPEQQRAAWHSRSSIVPVPASAPERSNALVEPLNEREREVLRLFAAALSNQAIADRLVVARSTVKWHINNLYSKLGVSSRAEALARAKELGLL